MPPEVEWPSWKGKPQLFLAQLDLAATHRAMPSFLPESGQLFVFYDQEQSVWGFDPEDAGAWKVVFIPAEPASLKERPAPEGLPPDLVFRTKFISPQRIETLPDSQMLPDRDFDWKRDGDGYQELVDEAYGGQTKHQMFGYARPIQNADMEMECQLVSNGINLGRGNGSDDPRYEKLKDGAGEWRLLLQLDTDDDTGWMWGDVGTIYFWIRESDARRGDFSKVWLVFQCC